MKKRLDQLLVEQGHAPDAHKAQALVMAGKVYTGTQRLDKAGQLLNEDVVLLVKGKEHPYVSRGGIKLQAALDHFQIQVAGFTALDIGASTGGFTDGLLLAGAAKVYAVDVGTNQLAWKLRQDPRVVVLEQTDARHLTPALIPDTPDLVVCDASFVRLQQVLPAALALLKPGGLLVALIKPQFELPAHEIGAGGIVRETALHEKACRDTEKWLIGEKGFRLIGQIKSPITGAEGNIEFLMAAQKPA